MPRSSILPDIGAYEYSSPPVLSTPTVSAVTAGSALIDCNVAVDGGAAVTERGIVYSISASNSDPLLGGMVVMKATRGGTTGGFMVNVTGLAQGVSYTFKAYATNILGTTYSIPVTTFTTLTRYSEWATANGISGLNSGPGESYLGDGIHNLLKYAFGINPATPGGLGTASAHGGILLTTGGPAIVNAPNGSSSIDNLALFLRRVDWQPSEISYVVEFSADLTLWVASHETPTSIGNDNMIEAVTVPFPALVNGQPCRFFRVRVTAP
jgi:hypothetical protein